MLHLHADRYQHIRYQTRSDVNAFAHRGVITDKLHLHSRSRGERCTIRKPRAEEAEDKGAMPDARAERRQFRCSNLSLNGMMASICRLRIAIREALGHTFGCILQQALSDAASSTSSVEAPAGAPLDAAQEQIRLQVQVVTSMDKVN